MINLGEQNVSSLKHVCECSLLSGRGTSPLLPISAVSGFARVQRPRAALLAFEISSRHAVADAVGRGGRSVSNESREMLKKPAYPTKEFRAAL